MSSIQRVFLSFISHLVVKDLKFQHSLTEALDYFSRYRKIAEKHSVKVIERSWARLREQKRAKASKLNSLKFSLVHKNLLKFGKEVENPEKIADSPIRAEGLSEKDIHSAQSSVSPRRRGLKRPQPTIKLSKFSQKS